MQILLKAPVDKGLKGADDCMIKTILFGIGTYEFRAREGVINDPVQKVPFNGSLALI